MFALRDSLRRLYHRLGDSGRLYWGLLYWNFRKSAYVLGGRRSSCPCQNLSDTGHPGETGCEAAHYWHEPRRFRRVCPLLQQGPHGWVCSVGSSQVRPFWGRALAIFAATVLAAYLLLAVAGWGVVRAAGVRTIPLGHLAWPPAWRQLKGDFADYYKQRALQAFHQRDFQNAYLSLITALHYRPDDYETDLLLAQITAFQGAGNLSDASFVRLSQVYPAQAHRTAVVFHDTLLATGRWRELAQHSLRMALADRREMSSWVQSLFHAARAGRLAGALYEKSPAEIAGLPEHPRRLLEALRKMEAGDDVAALRTLQEHYAGPLNPTYALLHIDMVLRLGRPDLAALLNGHYAIAFTPAQESCVQYRLDYARGDLELARADLAAVWRGRSDATALNAVLTALITYPDRACYLSLRQRLQEQRTLDLPFGALWVATLRCRVPEDAPEWARSLLATQGVVVPEITWIDVTSRKVTDPASPARLISVVPLSRDQIWALLDAPEAVPALRH